MRRSYFKEETGVQTLNFIRREDQFAEYFLICLNQGGHKEMSSILLTNSALVYEPK